MSLVLFGFVCLSGWVAGAQGLPFFAGEGVPGIQVVWSTPKFKWLGHPFLFFTWVGPCQFKCKGTSFYVLHGLVHARLDYPVCGVTETCKTAHKRCKVITVVLKHVIFTCS